MSFFSRRARVRAFRLAMLLGAAGAAVLGGCGPSPRGSDPPDAGPREEGPALPDREEAPPAPSLADLGPGGRRVTVLVLPGDASIEVDGFTARRRDGVIELAGKIGDVRRLRVFKGTRQLEHDVTIQEGGASPDSLDLSTRPVSHAAWPDEGKTEAPAQAPSVLLPEEFQ